MKFFKNNFKLIIGFVIGVIIASSITVYAYSYFASDIKYTDDKSVADALNDLYLKSKTNTEQDADNLYDNLTFVEQISTEENGKRKVNYETKFVANESEEYLLVGYFIGTSGTNKININSTNIVNSIEIINGTILKKYEPLNSIRIKVDSTGVVNIKASSGWDAVNTNQLGRLILYVYKYN